MQPKFGNKFQTFANFGLFGVALSKRRAEIVFANFAGLVLGCIEADFCD